jgi:hypothetical protein
MTTTWYSAGESMPEQVYHAAAVEWDRKSPRAASGDIVAPLRAAVEYGWRAGQTRLADIVEAACAYVDAPEGSDDVEHAWWALRGAVENLRRPV